MDWSIRQILDGWTSTKFSFACLRGTLSADTSRFNINSLYYHAIGRKTKSQKLAKKRNNRLNRKPKVNEIFKRNKKGSHLRCLDVSLEDKKCM